jgi:cytochrome oxidase Cu insertion factor (SCO1/SenC/PrrC family)
MTVFVKGEGMRPVALALCVLMLTVVATAGAAIPYIVGDTIADFTLYDAYGTPVSLYDYQNTVILLNFWTNT